MDAATLLTIIGFMLTIWLLYEAQHIRNSFLRRARLPQITKELQLVSKKLSGNLKGWDLEKADAINQLSVGKALLENLIPKLPDQEKRSVKIL